jgi:GNAT superfamily N-acetyltransferase
MNTNEINTASRVYVGKIAGRSVSFCSVLMMPGKNPYYRISRLVVLPDYQGIGIGRTTAEFVGALYRKQNKQFGIVSSHPILIRSFLHDKKWRLARIGKCFPHATMKEMNKTGTFDRNTYSLRYMGDVHE